MADQDAVFRPSRLTRREFLASLGGIYEKSPWVAERVLADGVSEELDSVDGLHAVMRAQVDQAGRDARLALLRAHPDLAGRLAMRGALTPESTSEQASAGLDQCSPAELEAFQSLNSRYREKFGFPFILAVRGRTRSEILDEFRKRVVNDSETEFATAMEQVHKIARMRIAAVFA